MRLYLAFVCFWRVLLGRPLPEKVLPAVVKPAELPPPAAPAAPARAAAAVPVPAAGEVGKLERGALQLLALFQREGRLVDFLSEAIEDFDDAAIGAAARDIHRGCKKALDEHFTLGPVLGGKENESVTVDAGFDPARIRLVGNVKGSPPLVGTLRHHGWAVQQVKLPERTAALDARVLAPAEVEV
jgi:hypothetical protein